MQVELKPVTKEDQIIVENLWELYLYDMSEYTGWAVSEEGKFTTDYPSLEKYWKNEDHTPFLIRVDGEIAGFSLLRRYPYDPEWNDIAQFFIMRKFKGKGIGRQAFLLSVKKYPGKWLTRVLENNAGSLIFWTTVIEELTDGNFTQNVEDYEGNKMYFLRYEV